MLINNPPQKFLNWNWKGKPPFFFQNININEESVSDYITHHVIKIGEKEIRPVPKKETWEAPKTQQHSSAWSHFLSLQRSYPSNRPAIWLLNSSFSCMSATHLLYPLLFILSQVTGTLLVLRWELLLMDYIPFLTNTRKFIFYTVYIYMK